MQIKNWLSLFREPFQGSIFKVLFNLIILFVPVVFSLYGTENFITIKYGIFVLLLGAILLFWFKNNERNFKYDRELTIWLFLFSISVFLSAFFSQDIFSSIFGAYRRMTMSLVFLLPWVIYIFFLNGFWKFQELFDFYKLSLVPGFVIAIYAILQFYGIGHYHSIFAANSPRPPSLLGNANFSSMFLSVTFPVLLYLLIDAYRQKWLFKFTHYLILLFIWFYALTLMGSRGAVLGSIIGSFCLLTLFILNFRNIKYGLRISLVGWFLVCVFAVMSFFYLKTTREVALSASDFNSYSRLIVWNHSLEIFKNKPVFGYGLGVFEQSFVKTREAYMAGGDYLFDDAHNIFIHILVEGGIILLISFGGLLLWAFIRAYNKIQNKDEVEKNIIILSSLVIWVVCASFSPVEITNWILLGLLLVLAFKKGQEVQFPLNFFSYKKYIIMFFIIIFMVHALGLIISEPIMKFARDYYYLQNYTKSKELSQIAWFLNPTHRTPLVFMIASDIKLREQESKIKKKINYLHFLHPKSAVINSTMGNLYYLWFEETKKTIYLDKSILYVNKAIAADPTEQTFRQMKARIYFESGNRSKAYELTRENIVKGTAFNFGFDNWVIMARYYQENNLKNELKFALLKIKNSKPYDRQLQETINLVIKTESYDRLVIPVEFSTILFE